METDSHADRKVAPIFSTVPDMAEDPELEVSATKQEVMSTSGFVGNFSEFRMSDDVGPCRQYQI